MPACLFPLPPAIPRRPQRSLGSRSRCQRQRLGSGTAERARIESACSAPPGRHLQRYRIHRRRLNIPEGIAIDGAGNVWVGQSRKQPDLSALPRQLHQRVQLRRYCDLSLHRLPGRLNISLRIAVDGSGNVWVPNATLNTVTEFVGAGSPVVTPIVANLLYPYANRAVNRP